MTVEPKPTVEELVARHQEGLVPLERFRDEFELTMTEEERLAAEQEFLGTLGRPAYRTRLPVSSVSLPKGKLRCCRVVHQASCEHYIARSITGVMLGFKLKGTRAYQHVGNRITSDGDIIADPSELLAVSTVLISGLGEAVRGMDGETRTLELAVWSLSVEQAKRWDELCEAGQRAIEALERERNQEPTAWIQRLPFKYVEPTSEDETYMALTTSQDFFDVGTYAHRIFTVPGEFGHDREYRYVVDSPWPAQEPTVTP